MYREGQGFEPLILHRKEKKVRGKKARGKNRDKRAKNKDKRTKNKNNKRVVFLMKRRKQIEKRGKHEVSITRNTER